MQHFDELILELFVLDAPEAKARKTEIEQHLAECYGCRAVVEELREFYTRLAGPEESAGVQQESTRFNLVPVPIRGKRNLVKRRTAELDKLFESAPAIHSITAIGRVQHLFRHHPVFATTSGITMVAVMALAINFAITNIFKDTNPSYAKLNEGSGSLEVYNGKYQLLWGVPVGDIASLVKLQNLLNVSLSAVSDLDDDGKNEVITVARNLGNENDAANLLHIYNADGKVLHKVAFGRSVIFKGIQYASDYVTNGLLVDDFARISGKEIIVDAANSHSPCVISRLNSSGELLGEYWHYGYLLGIYAIDFNNDTPKGLILTGLEDVDDPSCPVIVVMDPKKIVGTTESIASRGFGFKVSPAELFYIKLPRTDLNDALDMDCAVRRLDTLHYANRPALKFTCACNDTKREISFEYIFSKDMHLLEIKPSESTTQLRANLVEEGKLFGQIDSAYLENLAKNIRYWDGKAWSTNVVCVSHPNFQ